MSTLIECRELTCRYGAAVALERLLLEIPERAWVYLLGPSASGKTTLLRAIAGLEPLAGGEIRLAGAVASNHRIVAPPHARGIGFLFQEPSLWPHLSAAANVALGLAEKMNSRARRGAALGWLERLGVGHLAARFPAQLSGGEARRVALARALAARPRILLLDEPTAHLDIHLREELMATVRRLHEELALTTLCVTHQAEPPMQAADRTLILEGGRLLYDGALGEIENALETPYISALRRTLARL